MFLNSEITANFLGSEFLTTGSQAEWTVWQCTARAKKGAQWAAEEDDDW